TGRERLLVARGPLAVVVELGLQPLQAVQVVVALGRHRAELVDPLNLLLGVLLGHSRSPRRQSCRLRSLVSSVEPTLTTCPRRRPRSPRPRRPRPRRAPPYRHRTAAKQPAPRSPWRRRPPPACARPRPA